MGVPVLILGASGSGKSASLRNFSPEEIGVFNAADKELPFRKKLKVVDLWGEGINRYPKVMTVLGANNLKCYAIDDYQYMMSFDILERNKEHSFQKYNDCAMNFVELVKFIKTQTTPDTIVYLLSHTEATVDGRLKAKTVGKMIDNQITFEGLFSIVLYAETDGKEHWFTTQSNGFNTAKSPMDMFPAKIDNDLKAVDTAIREYYDFER